MRKVIIVLSVALIASLGWVGLSAPRQGERPNFIVVIADDLGWNDLGAYGNRTVRTPNIDALAAAGMRFDNAFLTTSSCSASRASILTGKYPHSNGLLHLHQALPPGEITVAELLQRSGYFTAAAGKWHIGGSARRGFDRVLEDRVSASGSEQWVSLLRSRPRGRPFFLWLAARDPHRPWDPGEADLPPAYRKQSIELPAGYHDGPGTRREFAQYYREISRFDAYVGAVVTELRRQSLLDSTLLLVMSDNGRPFVGGKMTLYDDGIKTPFIVHWPQRVAAGSSSAQLLSSVDLAPTLLELAGTGRGAGMQGVSFAPLLSGPDRPIREVVFAERNWHGRNAHERAVRSLEFLYKENQYPPYGDCFDSQYESTAHFRELRKAHESGAAYAPTADCFAARRAAVELLAVGDQGHDFHNLAGDPQFDAVEARLRERLAEWRRRTGDGDYRPYHPPQREAAPPASAGYTGP
jgi:N-sulfoglucosamine sulfohydrolase